MKTLILSDLHLGSPLFNKKDEVIKLLKCSEYDRIVLNGDIFDIWEDCFYDIIRKNTDIVNVINDVSTQKDVYYIEGNHDPDAVDLRLTFLYSKVVSELLLDDVFIIHGCQFDNLVNKYSWLGKILFVPHWITERIFGINLKAFFRKLFGKSLSSKRNKDYYAQLLKDVEIEAIDAYNHKCNYLVMGHTHFPKISSHDNCTYINCGDMIHNYTYVEYDDKLKDFKIKEV